MHDLVHYIHKIPLGPIAFIKHSYGLAWPGPNTRKSFRVKEMIFLYTSSHLILLSVFRLLLKQSVLMILSLVFTERCYRQFCVNLYRFYDNTSVRALVTIIS